MEEIEESRKEQNKNGSPGIDGLTPQFYEWAWEVIKDDVYEVINNCYYTREMPLSMRSAVVTLIPKTGDTTNIKNWRPVSLLTIDYKILSKIITKRLQEDISDKISTEQKCAIKKRQITDIHLNILAALKNSKRNGSPAIFTCYDFSKAFDMIDHSIIINTFTRMKVRKTTINWIKTMYKNIQSQIQINGALTAEILIRRGIRQGCPLSMLLFIIALETLTRTMKEDTRIRAPYKDMKLQQYADDLTTITEDALSDHLAQCHIENFCRISGLQLNDSKTKKMYINLNESQQLDLKHFTPEKNIKSELKILGIIFNKTELIPAKNWDEKVKKVEKSLAAHWKRYVSIFGKVKLINALALCHINYVAKVKLPEKRHITKLNSIIFKFLWAPRRIEQTSRAKITQLKEYGGLGIPNIKMRCDAIFTSRMKQVLSEEYEQLTEPWQKDAIYQLGTKIRSIAPNLLSNERPKADNPDRDYAAILKTITNLNERIQLWKETNIKQIYFKMFTRPPENNKTWSLALLREKSLKKFFSNREREIAWRTKQQAYKWNAWMAQNGRQISGSCVLCNQSRDDTIDHLLLRCPIVREIWININSMVRSLTTKNFIIDADLIKYNLVEEGENQLDWLIPIKTVNVAKVKLITWHDILSTSNKTLEDANNWIEKMVDKTKEDSVSFIEDLKENYFTTEEQQDRIYLRRH